MANSNTKLTFHVSVPSAGQHELRTAHIHGNRQDSSTAVGNKGYCHRLGIRPNFRSLADDAQIARVSAYSSVVTKVYRVC